MKVTLNCENLAERERAHAYLAETLGFPEYYGKNLDALYDCLTELGDCEITLEGMESAESGYAAMVLKVLEEAAQANPGLTVE